MCGCFMLFFIAGMDTQPAADCMSPIELLRKRTVDEVLEKSPTIKVPRLSSMENSHWSSPLSHFTNGIDDDDDSITIKHDNIRDRKQTDFFTPESSTTGQRMRNASCVKVYENARRALNFEDVDSNGKVPEEREEESHQNSPPHMDPLIKVTFVEEMEI